MKRAILTAALTSAFATSGGAAVLRINCDRGQSISAALTRLDRAGPNTIRVRGTCTESVEIRGFDRLTLLGDAGASVVMPEAGGGSAAIEAANSRDLLIADLTVKGRTPCPNSLCISLLIGNCQGCRVERSTLEGVTVLHGAANDATFLKDTLRSSGSYAAIASYDNGFATLVNCAVEPGSTGGWWGVQVDSSSAINIGGTTIRGHGNGIGVMNGARVSIGDLSGLPGADADQTVAIEDNWYRGIDVAAGSVASIGGVARIQNNGDGLGGRVGVMVRETSFASIEGGARIASTGGNGLVAVSNATVRIDPSVGPSPGPVEVSGSLAQDVFCDATSLINGASGLTAATKITCANLGEEAPLPSQ
jgi:hypothetical protein